MEWFLWVLGFLVFIIIIRTTKRGYFWKDRKGNEVGFKKFFKRWRKGIEGITPLQQAWTNLMGTWIVITGISSGIIIMALVRLKNYWLWTETILIGSLIVTVVQLIGGLQKYWRFKEIAKQNKELEQCYQPGE